MEMVTNQSLSEVQRRWRVVRQLQDSVMVKPSTFLMIVDILKTEDVTKDVATLLEGT